MLCACVIYVHMYMCTHVDCAYVHAYRVHMLASSVFLYYHLLFFLSRFLFAFDYVLVPMEARRGCWFYWSWSTRYSTGLGYWKLNSESSFNHWVICPAPLPLIIETRSLIKSRDHKLGKTNWPVNLRNSPVTSTASLCLALYMGATVLNSGAGACTGDTLLTWYLSRPKMQVSLAFALNLSQVIALIPWKTLLLRKRFVVSLRENLLHVTFWTCLIKNKQTNSKCLGV